MKNRTIYFDHNTKILQIGMDDLPFSFTHFNETTFPMYPNLLLLWGNNMDWGIAVEVYDCELCIFYGPANPWGKVYCDHLTSWIDYPAFSNLLLLSECGRVYECGKS